MPRKAKAVSDSPKVDKPKSKRPTIAALQKELDALKATNMKLLNEIGNLSAMYMNALSNQNKTSESQDKESVVVATKRVIAFLMQTYGFAFSDLTK